MTALADRPAAPPRPAKSQPGLAESRPGESQPAESGPAEPRPTESGPAGAAAGGNAAKGRGPVDPRLLRHARSSRAGIAVLALLGAGQAGATLLLAVALTLVVAGPRGHAVALLAAAYVARAGLSWAEQVVAGRTAARVTDELRRATLAAALRRGPAWVARYGSGRLAAVLSGGLDALRPWFSGYLPALVLGAALPPLVIIAMAVVDPASAVIALITLPLIPVLGALIGWATQARARQRWAADARLAGHFLDVVQGLPTLRVYGRAERQVEVVAAMTDRHRAATMRVLRVAFLSSTALDLVGTLSVGLIAVEAGLRVAGGSLALGPALLVILLAPEAYRPLREVAARFHASADATAVIADVDEVLADPPAAEPDHMPEKPLLCSPIGITRTEPRILADPPEPEPEHVPDKPLLCSPIGITHTEPPILADLTWATPHHALGEIRADRPAAEPDQTLNRPLVDGDGAERARTGVPGGVRVAASGLRVRHPGVAVDALALDALTVRAGEIVALRGPSGAGKTTALRALAGLQPLRSGLVELAGRRPLYLSQRPALAHARTVADTLAQPGEPALTAGQVRDALRSAGLDRELTPDTPLGERGQGVSAGQRQRLALAAVLRAARREPAVLLLDEPTAHLDAAAERLVIAQLRAAASRGCAILVVAHRPALLAAADRVIDIVTPTDGTPIPTATHGQRDTPAPVPVAKPATDEDRATTPAGRADGVEARGDLAGIGAHAPVNRGLTIDRPGPTAGPDPAAPTLGGDQAAAARAREAGRSPFGRVWSAVLRGPAAAVGLGAASWLAGVVLTGAAAWLLVRASTMPPVLTLSAAVVLVRASAVARPLLRYLERLAGHDMAFARLGARRAQVYADLIPRVPGPRQTRRGELLTRVVDDVDAMVDGLLRGRLPAAAAGLALGVTSVVAILVLPAAGPAIAAGLLLAAVFAPALAAWQATRRAAATAQARAELRDAVVETIDGLEDLAAAGGGALAIPDRRSRALAREEARAARAAGLAAAVGHLGWGVAVVGTTLALGGAPPEWAAVLLLGIVALGEPVGALPDAAVARRRAAGAQARLADLAVQQPSAMPGAGTATREPVSGALQIRGLVAGWDPDRRPALSGLDLDLAAGGRVAVLGPSGAGKSTLAAVLGRLLDPRAGTVTLGGVDLRELDDAAVRRRVGLVSEDADHVFASTVRENLRLARVDATDGELLAVLERVGLGFGLDVWLGAGGATISGGQRKRLATARALLADPDLLILDEPTEGLDGPGAEALMADLLAAARGRTVLVLTHRTEGLDRVDEIHRLENRALTTVEV